MRSVTDVYPPFWISPLRLIVVVALFVMLIVARLLVKRLLTRLALRAQRHAAAQALVKDPHILDTAIGQLNNLYGAYTRREISAAAAVEQASALVREAYDNVMNHSTRFQARYEIAARRLVHVEALITKTYPIEFVTRNDPQLDAAVVDVFAKAEEVIESCR